MLVNTPFLNCRRSGTVLPKCAACCWLTVFMNGACGWQEDSLLHPAGRRKAFSIVTTAANPLMEFIHNTKKRMPMMFSREEERRWLDPKLTKDEIIGMMHPLDENQMKAEVIEK
ncbi:hypothetical protein GJJ30_01205 [Larkinella terrae]|uniref:SOS response-associated peptidase n=2 Tax=Larkinella terrae TaxID=2025311 RepID=A0A7K0EDV9_9BACT|nr:hypothetical protein [Larkinella terrae]